jgi:hypothetical protein
MTAFISWLFWVSIAKFSFLWLAEIASLHTVAKNPQMWNLIFDP